LERVRGVDIDKVSADILAVAGNAAVLGAKAIRHAGSCYVIDKRLSSPSCGPIAGASPTTADLVSTCHHWNRVGRRLAAGGERLLGRVGRWPP